MELIDTHAHLTFDDLQDDIDNVIARSREAGVTSWVTVGTEPDQVRRVLDVVPKYDGLYAAVGFHPHDAEQITDDDMQMLKEAAGRPKVVAIGETGLDFHYNFSKQDAQHDIFRRHLDLAVETNLPVIIHSRNAFNECMAILDEYAVGLKNVVIHCFSGTADEAKAALDKGYHLSFTGIVTFKKTHEIRSAAAVVPLERLMVETDCPFISPEPVRNQKPCEPAMLVHTARKIAEVKDMSFEDFADAVTQTSRKFFGIQY